MRFLIEKCNFVIVISFLIICVSCAHESETEQLIKERFKEYTDASGKMNYSESYDYLSLISKENITPEEWEKYVFKIAGKGDHKIVRVIVAPIGTTARVDVLDSSKREYSQTWVKVENNWYRAFAEDNNLVKKDKLPSVYEGTKPEVQFDLVDLKKDWYLTVTSLQKEQLYQPQLQFKVKNVGTSEIKYLQLMAVFFEDQKKEIYDKHEEYVVGSGDVPLSPGYTSKTIFMRTSIGYVFSGYNQEKIFSQTFNIKLYYKTDYSMDWKLFKEL